MEKYLDYERLDYLLTKLDRKIKGICEDSRNPYLEINALLKKTLRRAEELLKGYDQLEYLVHCKESEKIIEER